MMQARIGDVVRLRDGRRVEVTDAPESLEPLEWINEHEYKANGREVVMATMPAETIFGGNLILGTRVTRNRVYSDMSDIVDNYPAPGGLTR